MPKVLDFNSLDALKIGSTPVIRAINKGNVVSLQDQGTMVCGRDPRLYSVQMYFDTSGKPESDRFSDFVCTTKKPEIFDQTGLGMNTSTQSVASYSTNLGVLRTSNCPDAIMSGVADAGNPSTGNGAVEINTAALIPAVNSAPQPQPYPGYMGWQFFFKWEDNFPPPAAPCALPLCVVGGTSDISYVCRLYVESIAGDVATCKLQAFQCVKSTNSISLISQTPASFSWTFSEWYCIAYSWKNALPDRSSFQSGCDEWIFSIYGGGAGTSAPDLATNTGGWITTPPMLDYYGNTSMSNDRFKKVLIGGQTAETSINDFMVKGLLFDNFATWSYLANSSNEPLIPQWFYTVEDAGGHSPTNHCLLFEQGDIRQDLSGDINCGYECERYQSGVYEPQYCGPADSPYNPAIPDFRSNELKIQAGYNGVGGAGTPFASYSNWHIRRKGDSVWQYFASPTPVVTAYAGVMEEEGKTQEEIAEALEGIDEERIKEELAKVSDEMGLYIVKLDCKLPEDYDELYSRVQENHEFLKERLEDNG